MDKLICSLKSDLPNEVDFAIQVATLLANSNNFLWSKDHQIVDAICASLHVFACVCDCPQSCYCYSKFWRTILPENLISNQAIQLATAPPDIDPAFMKFEQLNKHQHKQHKEIYKRIKTVAEILRQFSMTTGIKHVQPEQDQHPIYYNLHHLPTKKKKNKATPRLLKFVSLLLHCDDVPLNQIGLDILSNTAPKLSKLADRTKDPSCPILIQMFYEYCVNRVSQEDGDIYAINRSIDVISRLIASSSRQVSSNMINLIIEHDIISRIEQLLTSRHDVTLFLTALECFYRISRHQLHLLTSGKAKYLMKILINLLNCDAPCYFTSTALKRIKLVDEELGQSIASSPLQDATPALAPVSIPTPIIVTNAAPVPSPASAPKLVPIPPPTPASTPIPAASDLAPTLTSNQVSVPETTQTPAPNPALGTAATPMDIAPNPTLETGPTPTLETAPAPAPEMVSTPAPETAPAPEKTQTPASETAPAPTPATPLTQAPTPATPLTQASTPAPSLTQASTPAPSLTQASTPAPPLTQASTPTSALPLTPAPTPITGEYACEWNNCTTKFKNPKQVYIHVFEDHIKPLPSDSLTSCQWSGPNGVGPGCLTKRPKYSLLTHLNDFHCNPSALLRRTTRSQATVKPPEHPGYAPNAAFLAIKRHAASSVENVNWTKNLQYQSPLSVSVRLTAALTLKNLASGSLDIKKALENYEPLLSEICMSHGRDESKIIAECLSLFSNE